MARFQPKLYIKDTSFDPIYKSANPSFYLKSRILPGLLLSLGFLILGTQVIYPLVDFKTQDKTATTASASVLGMATGFSQYEFRELNETEDEQAKYQQDLPPYFSISIPKLGITNAQTELNSTQLNPDKYLGHYKGSGIPGEVGNAFIYGHSVLPWFYNPKNYKTIFSTLDQLQTGDEIQITLGRKKLTYKVEGMEILPIDKVNPLAEYKPRYLNESTITLMTCWPAGTRAKRLVVRAVLVS